MHSPKAVLTFSKDCLSLLCAHRQPTLHSTRAPRSATSSHSERAGVTLFFKRLASWKSLGTRTPQGRREPNRKGSWVSYQHLVSDGFCVFNWHMIAFNVVLVSALQQFEPALSIHISLPAGASFLLPSPASRSSQGTALSSSCWFYTCVWVCVCVC